MPDDFFKKLPKVGKINFGAAKVHLCRITVKLSKSYFLHSKKVAFVFFGAASLPNLGKSMSKTKL